MKARRVSGEAKLQTWLFAVIRKTAVSERRQALLRALLIGAWHQHDAPVSLESQPDIEFARSEMQQRFVRALDNLPRRQRETLHLVFYQDLSLREAAAVMGVSIGSARRHYERGKIHLRETLKREEFEYGLAWRRENSGVVL